MSEFTISSLATNLRKVNSVIAMMDPSNAVYKLTLSFVSLEATRLAKPHDDALVISLNVANVLLKRILIDPGSYANLLFVTTLTKLENLEIEDVNMSLVRFFGERVLAVGQILLPVYVEGVNFVTKFLIVERDLAYNAILIRPWIHAIKFLPSTYH